MADQPDDLFHVVPFERRPDDGPKVIFLVTNLRTGVPREIVVERDDMDFYAFTVNGGAEPYDPEAEPAYLTCGLMDATEQALLREELGDLADAFAIRMFTISDKRRTH